ncbi:hypothetical protein DAI22_05g134300 [Oryza sativa Japonica Group]|nr:hypothetical protein DAI22_05g134300 [Oryza sativa Japonica Group]
MPPSTGSPPPRPQVATDPSPADSFRRQVTGNRSPSSVIPPPSVPPHRPRQPGLATAPSADHRRLIVKSSLP